MAVCKGGYTSVSVDEQRRMYACTDRKMRIYEKAAKRLCARKDVKLSQCERTVCPSRRAHINVSIRVKNCSRKSEKFNHT